MVTCACGTETAEHAIRSGTKCKHLATQSEEYLESEMSNQITERTVNSRYVIKVQNGRLDFYSQFANFVQKRELCGQAAWFF